MWEKRNSCIPWVGMYINVTAMKSNMDSLQKLKNRTKRQFSDTTLGYISEGVCSNIYWRHLHTYCTTIHISQALKIAQMLNN
jgi:regulator of sigma D